MEVGLIWKSIPLSFQGQELHSQVSLILVSTVNKRRLTDSQVTTKRRQTQPHKRRGIFSSFFHSIIYFAHLEQVLAVDIEARKRELVEGIKKLGGTGATRPIRKKGSLVWK